MNNNDAIAAATARRLAENAAFGDWVPTGAKITGRKRSTHSKTHSLGMNGKRRSRDAR
jgi:hypothetical protein